MTPKSTPRRVSITSFAQSSPESRTQRRQAELAWRMSWRRCVNDRYFAFDSLDRPLGSRQPTSSRALARHQRPNHTLRLLPSNGMGSGGNVLRQRPSSAKKAPPKVTKWPKPMPAGQTRCESRCGIRHKLLAHLILSCIGGENAIASVS